MATRIVEGKRPYTGGKAITVDENRVISLNLRGENNMIIWDEGDNEIYVDLQIPDGRTPIDAFPVGVNTGRVSSEDGWDVTGTIISAKTTSGDNIKILYGDEDGGTLWIDNGTGTFKQIYFKGDVDSLISTLQSQIDVLSGLGKFLSLWDCVNGEPMSFPLETPYEYSTGDYYLIGNVSSATPPVNYRPAGDEWIDDDPSTKEPESATVERGDTYIYDGTVWLLQKNTATGGTGTGDVIGPVSATDGHLAVFDGTTGKVIKDGGPIPTGAGIEYKTQAEYDLLTPDPDKHYFIYHTTGGGGGWQPGANTLAYYPFDTDILDHSSNSRALTGDTGTKGTIGYTFTSNVKILNADLPSNVKFINFRYKFNSASGNQGVIVAGGLQQLCMSYYAFGRNGGSPSGLDNVITAFIGSGWVSRSHAGPSDIYSWHNICLGYDGSDTMCAIDGVRYSLQSGLDPSAVTDELYLLLVDSGMAGSVELADFIVESQGWTAQEISDYYDNTKSKFGIN